MNSLSLFFYNIFLRLYPLGIRIASIWNDKASLWIKGRKNIFEKIHSTLNTQHSIPNTQVIWMHCASLGEFEQGLPLIEKIRKEYTRHTIVITFFSPSGYEIQKKFKGADHIFYLPADSYENAKKFIALINPTLVLWIKYEFWYHYLQELKKRKIPVLLISGAFRTEQPFFKWYGNFWKKMLDCFRHYFLQNEDSKILLEKIGIKNISVSGDTRFDRVIQIAENFEEISLIKEFIGQNKVIVAGSTWEDDEAEIIHYAKVNSQVKLIIAPHEVDKENLADVKKEFSNSIFYSEWIKYNKQQAIGNRQSAEQTTNYKLQTTNCLIIDNIGILSRLYKYADITYVGGGFGDDGLHNILEAAVYGKPVIFGPHFEKNFEAEELIEYGGGIVIENALDLEKVFNRLLNDDIELKKYGAAAKDYVYNKAGATEKILNFIQENRLLTN